ncbi:MAG: hypothetical protein NTW50_01795 [Candidatus Berkelbacteria bacterium]|nr:hypothetical protein [Candidatus Berkelbacteria bacterium]
MKITICGSMKHADKMVKAYKKLQKIGHTPVMHEDVFGIASGTAPELIEGITKNHAEVKKKYDFIKIWHGLIMESDAILVCNYDRNGIKNYVGGNTLMEIGFAYTADKKIFLINPIPDGVSYADEIKAMFTAVLDGDLSKIENSEKMK